MKPNFNAMTRKELRAYVLEHRDDAEAISVVVEKIKADPNTHWHKPEDTDRFPEIYAEHQKRREEAQRNQENEP